MNVLENKEIRNIKIKGMPRRKIYISTTEKYGTLDKKENTGQGV